MLDLCSLIWNFGESYRPTTIVRGITAQPDNLCSIDFFVDLQPVGCNLNRGLFDFSKWGGADGPIRWPTYGFLLAPLWHIWSISYRFGVTQVDPKAFPPTIIGHDDNCCSTIYCFVERHGWIVWMLLSKTVMLFKIGWAVIQKSQPKQDLKSAHISDLQQTGNSWWQRHHDPHCGKIRCSYSFSVVQTIPLNINLCSTLIVNLIFSTTYIGGAGVLRLYQFSNKKVSLYWIKWLQINIRTFVDDAWKPPVKELRWQMKNTALSACAPSAEFANLGFPAS